MLTSLHLKGFKSFDDERMALGGLTVLVGANASGKSTGTSIADWRRDLQELREALAPAYQEASRIGVEALEAGAHHPPLDALMGDLYWRVFKRLYPARVPSNRQIQRLATDILKLLAP